jgi:hypothetical protein
VRWSAASEIENRTAVDQHSRRTGRQQPFDRSVAEHVVGGDI